MFFAMSSFPARKLWYDSPAGNDWNRALPVGAGRIGAMVFGNRTVERIQLNEDSLWSGGPRDRINPDALASLPEIRRLLAEGKLAAAQALTDDALAGMPDSMRCYEPLADLLFRFGVPKLPATLAEVATASGSLASREEDDSAAGYRRELDLEEGIVTVDYVEDGIGYRRTHLASGADNALVFRFEADRPGALTLRLRL
jgi:alpha-L-fucosidase 2